MTEFLLTFLNELTIAALAALPVIEFKGRGFIRPVSKNVSPSP